MSSTKHTFVCTKCCQMNKYCEEVVSRFCVTIPPGEATKKNLDIACTCKDAYTTHSTPPYPNIYFYTLVSLIIDLKQLCVSLRLRQLRLTRIVDGWLVVKEP